MSAAAKTEAEKAAHRAIAAEQEHLQNIHSGAGNPATTRHVFAENIARDSLAAYVGSASLTRFLASAQGVSTARARHDMLDKMHQPVGPPPPEAPMQE